MKAKEVHKLSDEELEIEVERLRRKLFDLRTQAVTEKIQDTSQFGKITQGRRATAHGAERPDGRRNTMNRSCPPSKRGQSNRGSFEGNQGAGTLPAARSASSSPTSATRPARSRSSFSVKHPKYGKYIRRRTVLHVHDETERVARRRPRRDGGVPSGLQDQELGAVARAGACSRVPVSDGLRDE